MYATILIIIIKSFFTLPGDYDIKLPTAVSSIVTISHLDWSSEEGIMI
jgi:hypothetical protein